MHYAGRIRTVSKREACAISVPGLGKIDQLRRMAAAPAGRVHYETDDVTNAPRVVCDANLSEFTPPAWRLLYLRAWCRETIVLTEP